MARFATAFLFLSAFLLTSTSPAQVKFTTWSEESKGKWSAKATVPSSLGSSSVQTLALKEFRKAAKEMYDRFRKDAKAEEREGWPTSNPWTLELGTSISLNRPDLVSGYIYLWDYTGGAHPNSYYFPLSFGIANGKAKLLRLSDLLAKSVTPKQFADEFVTPAIDDAKAQRGAPPMDEALDPTLYDCFVITPKGLTWMLAPYSVGPYVEGSYEVKILLRDIRSQLNPSGPLKALLAGL